MYSASLALFTLKKKSILDHLKSAPNLVSYQIALRKLWFCTLSHIQCWSTCEPQCECKLEPSWRTSSADLSSSVSTWTVCWPLCNKKQQHRCVLFILKQFLHYKASPPESSLFFNCNSYLWNIIKSCLCKLLNKKWMSADMLLSDLFFRSKIPNIDRGLTQIQCTFWQTPENILLTVC